MENEATPPQPGSESTLVNTREHRWSKPSGRTQAPGSQEVRTAVGSTPRNTSHGAGPSGEKQVQKTMAIKNDHESGVETFGITAQGRPGAPPAVDIAYN